MEQALNLQSPINKLFNTKTRISLRVSFVTQKGRTEGEKRRYRSNYVGFFAGQVGAGRSGISGHPGLFHFTKSGTKTAIS